MNHYRFACWLRNVHRRHVTLGTTRRLICPTIRRSRVRNDSKIGFRSCSGRPGKDEDEQEAPTIWAQLQSPPNLITLARIASTPLLAYWVISEEYELAMFGVVIAAISDSADGYLAKRYGWSTTVGSYLDPIADKVMVNALGISLWYSGVLPTPLVALWATKDILLLSGTAYNVYQRHRSVNIFATSSMSKTYVVKPTLLGKASTLVQFSTLAVGISTPVVGLAPVIFENLCWLSGGLTIASTISYASQKGMAQEGNGSKRKR
mmetsp:Transcript_134776/g.200559  ORF Transcript_134776/g.200559 Transcript_134776/m.200559 type:complete len:263 (-) Transcript_134776:229-1017(-)